MQNLDLQPLRQQFRSALFVLLPVWIPFMCFAVTHVFAATAQPSLLPVLMAMLHAQCVALEGRRERFSCRDNISLECNQNLQRASACLQA